MSRLAAAAHERVLGGSTALNRILVRAGLKPRRYGTLMTLPVKHVMQRLCRFDMQLTDACLSAGCHGVVYGHTHSPRLVQRNSIVVANTGDWLEHCSALIESHSGQLELWQADSRDWMHRRANRVALIPRSRRETVAVV